MEDKKPFILLNSEKNDKFRALIQSPGVLNYPEFGDVELDYTPESIKKAMNGLVGQQIADGSHFSVNGGNEFATIYNSGYCPKYGGYVDFEVFRDEYIPLFENIAKNIQEKGIYPKKGFSTEPNILNAKPTGPRSASIQDMEFEGLVWTDRPRDKKTGICQVLLNELPEKLRGDQNMGNEDKTVPKAQYDQVVSKVTDLTSDKTDLTSQLDVKKSALEKLQGQYDEIKTNYEKAKTKITELTDQLKPYLEGETEAKKPIVNELVKDLEGDAKTAAEKKFMAMDMPILQILGKRVLNEEPEGGSDGDEEGEESEESEETEGNDEEDEEKEDENKNKGKNKGAKAKGGIKGGKSKKRGKKLSKNEKKLNAAIEKYKPKFE